MQTERNKTRSAFRGLCLGFIALAVLCAGLFGWGTMASLSGAVIALGQVEPIGGSLVVEHVTGGTISDIQVKNGDFVNEGDILVSIDDKLLQSEITVFETELFELVAARNRLEAVIRANIYAYSDVDSSDSIQWDPDLIEAAEHSVTIRDAMIGYQRLYEAQLTSSEGLSAQLNERILQTNKQILGLEAQIQATDRQRRLVSQELDMKRDLFAKKLIRLPEVLELERALAGIDGRAGDLVAQTAVSRAKIAELETQILQIRINQVEEAETEVRQIQARENEIRERLRSLYLNLSRLKVRAPSPGIVHNLTVLASGEVVHPGEAIAHIVPAESGFMVRAQLEPNYVDQVWLTQPVILRFSAFSASTTPEYRGTVSHVSADALYDERTGIYWYEVEIDIGDAMEIKSVYDPKMWFEFIKTNAIEWTQALIDDIKGNHEQNSEQKPDSLRIEADKTHAISHEPLPLAPGMPVETYIQFEDRTPLNYLLKPFTDYFNRSMREA